MKYSTYISNINDIKNSSQTPSVKKLIFCFKEFSLFPSSLSVKEWENIKDLIPNNKVLTLAVDSLIPERDFQTMTNEIKLYSSNFNTLRVKDIGLANWIAENLPDNKIELVFDCNNNNIEALKGWSSYFKNKLALISLSLQLPAEQIAIITKEIQEVDFELLCLGPILLFYTPRYLLSYILDSKKHSEQLYAIGKSNESSNRPFPVVESQFGTLMYNDKDLFLFDLHNKLSTLNLTYHLIDLRMKKIPPLNNINWVVNKLENNPNELKKLWDKKTTHGFFNSNKTDAQFKRLKGKSKLLTEQNFAAKILSILDSGSILFAEKDFNANSLKQAITPDGKTISLNNCKILNLNMEEVSIINKEEVAILIGKKLPPGSKIAL